MCRLFNENRIWERALAGEYAYRIDERVKGTAFEDHKGNICTKTQLLTIWDPRYESGDPRREVAAQVNRHVTDSGVVGGSGLWDPAKAELSIQGTRYRKFKTAGGREPRCELCEGGDMIPETDRFVDSEYRPKRQG